MVQLDFIVMGIFALLIFAIGLTFTRVGSKNGQAFFEAGGETPWWINGLSLFISYFSAGTFVVWGSIAYKYGVVANAIQLTMAISGFIVMVFIAAKWKKTGVSTAAEFIGKRFGAKEKQFYTYMTLLLSLFTTAAVLYPVGKMVHVATDLPVNTCIFIIGLIIVLYTAAGGLWAVLVTDVVQFVILSAAVVIVIPIAFGQIGGFNNLIKKAPAHFFEPFNSDYTFGFMLAFIVYQTFYIGGNWSYVQRYTSVKDEKNAKKVAGIFTILYFISPVIWMLPPMIYRVINPDLQGLQTEDAYMMLIQKVMPAGLIGLVLAGMVSATSSKANTTINMAATVFAQDIYKNLLRPSSSEKQVIWMARLFTLLFGVLTILVAMWIPSAGGIVEVVLSTASIAGGALFAPIIWTLFSKRQTGFSVVTITISALVINLFFKVISPALLDFKLSRTMETVLGMGIPIFLLAVFELHYANRGFISEKAMSMIINKDVKDQVKSAIDASAHFAAEKQNIFGIRVIAISMAVVGLGITFLGIIADAYSLVIIAVGILILLAALAIYKATVQSKQKEQNDEI
ncbi:sodium:solute symporter family protein [Pedobacter agri]|uniref:sodium:solute symporter family protein n=1 Tax=Pedobacter agri TaxID=454586 RepID=UPI000E36A378|nr:sodium:solute symporter family protein [Pedobacter agri]MDQ1142877.1 SSS family solute:Na+ symporter [Pedobacter agri]